jgi:hypothetical protein
MTRRRKESGALLGIVLIMLMVLMAASVFAFFTLRTDSGATANDRLARQLFDCAEQGLAIGKNSFSSSSATGQWLSYYLANQTGTATTGWITAPPSPPFPLNPSGTPTAGYPITWCAQGCTYQPVQITLGSATTNAPTLNLNRTVAIYNNPAEPITTENDNQTVVWSQCTEPGSGQSRSVQALLYVTPQKNGNYFGQAGFGYNNSGNTNNTR